MKKLLAITGLLLLISTAAFADIARPDRSPNRVPKPKSGINSTLVIRLDQKVNEAKLIIPRSQIKDLRAQLDELEGDQDTAAAATSPATFSRTQTIVSGMFLSLAMVFGGIWVVRSGKAATRGGKSLVVVAVVAGIASAATFVYANAGPPSEARVITGKMFSQAVHMYKYGSGKIKVETKAEGDSIELIVPDPPSAPSGDE